MENVENTYCRFCAELKGTDKVLDLRTDEKKWDELLSQLAFVNALYVNVNNDCVLPKTICFVCYDSLNKAYEFLDKVKEAQTVLSELFSVDKAGPFHDHSDENCDELSDDAVYDPPECSKFIKAKDEITSDNDGASETPTLVIKSELKDEAPDNYLEALSKETSSLASSLEKNDDLIEDVSGIFEAALNSTSFSLHPRDLSELSNREIKTWQDYPWICTFCNIEFVTIDMLRSHARVAHGKCSAFMCIDCRNSKPVKFATFIKHVRKHRKYLRNFCYYCHVQVDKGHALNVHLKTHFKKSQLACPSCGEIQTNEEALNRHLQTFGLKRRRQRRKPGTPITVEDLTCPLCHKVYKNPNSLRDHRKLHTDRQRNYTCDRCGKMFYNKGTLTSHIMGHDDVRPHVCRICNKSFRYPNVLRKHVGMHTGLKPHTCDECGRSFRLPHQLKSHRIVHTDSMPHVCQYCNKAFRFKQILRNHERQHTGVKPYGCKHCGMQFTNWSNYNKHMKRRHGTDISKKKITPEGVFHINPQTGQIVQVDDSAAMGEWKKKIMLPVKRGKKPLKKEPGS